nr:hypothetical protein [Streptomyces laculatispora]
MECVKVVAVVVGEPQGGSDGTVHVPFRVPLARCQPDDTEAMVFEAVHSLVEEPLAPEEGDEGVAHVLDAWKPDSEVLGFGFTAA